jgi:hypothetical protein
MRDMPEDKEGELVKNMFKSVGMTASGTMHKEDPTALLDTYQYGMKLEIKDFLQQPGAGAFAIMPLFGSATSVQAFAWSTADVDDDMEVACSSGLASEAFEYEFPSDVEILSIPDNMGISNDFLSYNATYLLDGKRLRVQRTFDDRTRGNICTAEVITAYKTFSKKVMANLKAQVLYKWTAHD